MEKVKEQPIITMNDIVQEGDPILRKKVDKVRLPITEETQDELERMMQYLRNSQDPELAEKYGLKEGIGLSGNQVGLNKRMFVVLFDEPNGVHHEYKFINPRVITRSVDTIYLPSGEGCLSVNREIEGHVPRYKKIKFEALDENGVKNEYTFEGFAAIVMQHEIDHLNGVLFFDRISKKKPFLSK